MDANNTCKTCRGMGYVVKNIQHQVWTEHNVKDGGVSLTEYVNAGCPECAENIAKAVNEFAAVVNVGGIGHILGLAKGDNESEEDFKKRMLDRANYKPKTKAEYNAELFAWLKDHFINRLSAWCVFNDGNDFEIQMTESGDNWQPCITLKVYPSGAPLESGKP